MLLNMGGGGGGGCKVQSIGTKGGDRILGLREGTNFSLAVN